MKNLHLDRRSRYSQKVIQEALLSLLQEKEMNEITITDICRLADVNRGTFYKYYQDVDDLFLQIEDEFVDEIRALMEQTDSDSEQSIERSILKCIETLSEHEDYVRIVQKVHSTQRVVAKLFSSFQTPLLQVILSQYPDVTDLEMSYIFDYIISGLSTIVTKWLDEGKVISTRELTSLIIKIVL